MSYQVDAILHQIDRLDEADRFLLKQRLQEMEEAEWKTEAESARAMACERGIDQPAIDAAIDELRYGS